MVNDQGLCLLDKSSIDCRPGNESCTERAYNGQRRIRDGEGGGRARWIDERCESVLETLLLPSKRAGGRSHPHEYATL